MRYGFLLISTFLILKSFAQEERPEIDIQEFIETMFQVPDEQVNYDDLNESLYQLYTNPIDLNNTSKNELNSLYILSPAQINALISYINSSGPLLSIYELQVVDGFDNETLQKILPFVEVGRSIGSGSAPSAFQRMIQESQSYFILRGETILEQQRGYRENDSSKFLGSPHKIYGRFRFSHSKDFSVGLTFEKDAGEQVSWNPANQQYGFDYYSYHLYLENKGNFKKIALGDYQMQYGQGLVVGSGFNPGKGAETITTVRRGNSGIRPYTSVLESGFMRGAAATYNPFGGLELSGFYSRMNQDGSIRIQENVDEYLEYVSGIQDIGLHRTHTELANRNQINEQTYGFNITYNHLKSRNFQTGVTAINTNYSIPISKTPNNYNQFEFSGTQNHNIGIFTNFNWQNFLFFGEWATCKSGGQAYVAGLIGSLSPKVSLSFSIRNYEKDYHSFYGNAFGEGSRIINEKGLYWGLQIKPIRKITLSAFYDRFKFPWLRYRTEAPSDGYEYLVKAEYRPNKQLKIYGQYRVQSKELTLSQDGENLNRLVAGIKRSFAGNLDTRLLEIFEIKSRIQFSTYDELSSTKGMTFVQDLSLDLNKWKISARYALFDTEDYENRQYVYERDVLYAFNIPAYAGVGTRSYLLVQYKPNRKIAIWVKFGQYRYQDVKVIGSGLNEIAGDTRSEIKFQTRISF